MTRSMHINFVYNRSYVLDSSVEQKKASTLSIAQKKLLLEVSVISERTHSKLTTLYQTDGIISLKQ